MAGLYSGIVFNSGPSSSTDAPSSHAAAASSSNVGPIDTVADDKQAAALQDAARYAAASAEQAAAAAAEGARKAALTFQPIVRKRPAPGANKPKNVLAATAHISAGPVMSNVPTPVAGGSASPATVTLKTTISAPPAMLADNDKSAANVLTGRTLIVPPSMTMDEEDVNGFKASAAGKKAANKNKKRKGKGKREEDPALAWTAEYDPARPTDYNEYKIYAKVARAERREAARREREAERRRQTRQGYGESGSGSDYTGSSDDDGGSDEERRRRIANAEKRFVGFAPPKVYDMPPEEMAAETAKSDVIDVDMEPETKLEDNNEPVVVTEAPADDWAAWSAAPKAEEAVADDPYARRMALSQQQSRSQEPIKPEIPEIVNPAEPAAFAPLPVQQPSFSTSHLPIPGLPPNIPMPPVAWYERAPASGSPVPSNVAGGSSPYASGPLQQNPAPSGSVSIEEAQAKARAIAARLASLGKLGSTSASLSSASSPYQMPGADEPIPGLGMPSDSAPKAPRTASTGDPKDFAKDLMAKYGWSKGQGLGATSQGMLNPLALSSEATKKGKKKEEVVANKVTGMATAKGRVISDLKSEKDKTEREKYGEPTRIVCLTNMVGREDAGDPELAEDVSEEARKHGILEQCFVHAMPPYVPEDEAVRVFITFSGLVGAWKAVKAFDGRFFGGRTVRAKFYDETAFATRTLHL